MKTTDFEILKTPFENELTDTPWQDYPRPSLKRDSYLNLNGKWELSVRRGVVELPLGEVLVPFPVESRLSGICRELKEDEILIYNRSFTLPNGFLKSRLLLHF